MTVEPLSERMLNNKQHWQQVGSEILQSYGCEETYVGIGRCIDLWKQQSDTEVKKYKETETRDQQKQTSVLAGAVKYHYIVLCVKNRRHTELDIYYKQNQII